jgi:hypothetical protein
MMHFSCDLCGKEIQPSEDQRYVVKVEILAAEDPSQITDADLDEDNLQAISEILQGMEEGQNDIDFPAAQQKFRFDLCGECKKKFIRNPLGRESSQKLSFSKN